MKISQMEELRKVESVTINLKRLKAEVKDISTELIGVLDEDLIEETILRAITECIIK